MIGRDSASHLEALHVCDVAHWSDAALAVLHVDVEQIALGVNLQGTDVWGSVRSFGQCLLFRCQIWS